MRNCPRGAGSQFAPAAPAGRACWMASVSEPSAPAAEPRRAVADRVAARRVGMEVAVVLVHRERPERIRRRQLPAREPDAVAVAAVQEPPAAVSDGGRVHGLRPRVRPQRELGDHGPAEVVAAVVADVAERHEPAVVAAAAVGVHAGYRARGQPRAGPGARQERLSHGAARLGGRREPGPDPNRAERPQRAVIGRWRGIRGQRLAQLVEVRKALRQHEPVLLGREGRQQDRVGALPGGPVRQRREPVLAHQLGDRSEVGGILDERAADQPDQVRRAAEPLDPRRERPRVPGRHEHVRPRLRAGGAPADVRERVRVGVHELEHVVAAAGVGHVDHARPVGEVDLPDGVGGVHVGRDHRAHVRLHQLRDADDLVAREARHRVSDAQRAEPVDVGRGARREGTPGLGALVAPLGAVQRCGGEPAEVGRARAEGAAGHRGRRGMRRGGQGCRQGQHQDQQAAHGRAV